MFLTLFMCFMLGILVGGGIGLVKMTIDLGIDTSDIKSDIRHLDNVASAMQENLEELSRSTGVTLSTKICPGCSQPKSTAEFSGQDYICQRCRYGI
jgi:hypothetical protein